MQQRAEDLAYGRWPDILQHAGVHPSYFNGKAGPCPLCPGGTDRFIWQHKNGGRWLCRHCSDARYSGGMEFLIRWRELTCQGARGSKQSFIEAANYVRDFFHVSGHAAPVVPRIQAEQSVAAIDVEAARERMERLWSATHAVTADDPVDRYLRRRIPGLGAIPVQLRYHPRLAYYDPPPEPGQKPELVGYFPAMLVRGLNAEGELVQLHKTYLSAEGQKAPVAHPKKTDRGVGANSFAFRLGEPQDDVLGLCEGIETAVAAFVLDGIETWPCHSSSILANFVLPGYLRGQVKRVRIYADYDELKNGRRAGSIAAAQCADGLRREGVRTLIVRPAKVGTDMADLAAAA